MKQLVFMMTGDSPCIVRGTAEQLDAFFEEQGLEYNTYDNTVEDENDDGGMAPLSVWAFRNNGKAEEIDDSVPFVAGKSPAMRDAPYMQLSNPDDDERFILAEDADEFITQL